MSHPIKYCKAPQGDKRPAYLRPIAPWHVAQYINELNTLDESISASLSLGLIERARGLQERQKAVIADLLNGVIENEPANA